MFKKLFIAGLAVAGGMFILHSTHLGSYARTAFQKARSAAKQQMGLEFQLDTIRNEAAQLIPDIRNQLVDIAREEVAVKNLRNDVVTMRVSLDKQKENVRVMRDDLKSGVERIVYNGHSYSPTVVREKLSRELASGQRCAAELLAREKLLEARERNLDLEKEKLNSMKSQKSELEIQIAQLETEIKTFQLSQTKSTFQIDDSRLARIKDGIRDIRNQLDVAKKTQELVNNFEGDFTVEKAPTQAELTKQVDEFLNGGDATSTSETKVVTKK
jgi:hypothetical protein